MNTDKQAISTERLKIWIEKSEKGHEFNYYVLLDNFSTVAKELIEAREALEIGANQYAKSEAENLRLSYANKELLEALEMCRKHYNEVDENGFIHGSTPEFRKKIAKAIQNNNQ